MCRKGLMHRIATIFATGFAAWTLGAQAQEPAATPAEPAFGAAAGTAYSSRYVWRGQLLNDDPVMHPDLTLSFGKLSLNAWGSINTRNVLGTDNEAYRFQEIDWILNYAFEPSEDLSLDAGVIRYDFPGTGFSSTTEIYGKLGFPNLPLSPLAELYHDVDEAGGLYGRLGVSKEFEINDCLTAALGAKAGWGNKRYHKFYLGGLDESDASDFELSASLTWAATEKLSVSALASYTNFLATHTRKAAVATYGDQDVYTFGTRVAFEF